MIMIISQFMIVSIIKSKFVLKQFLKGINMRWVLFDIVILEFRTPVHSIVHQSFISGNLLICKLVHTSGDNK